MTCKHKHECEQCVREEITKVEAKLAALRKKLPNDRVIYIQGGTQYIQLPYHRAVPMPLYQGAYCGGLSNGSTISLCAMTTDASANTQLNSSVGAQQLG